MRYAIISDIHANESALRHVLADAAELDVDQVVCLGDVVGYGPLPKDALALVRKSCSIVLAGNHDDAVSRRRGADDFIDLAGDAVKRHRDTLGSSELGWLKNLPYACKLEGAIAAHGDFTNPPDFNYVDDEASATANFKTVDAQSAIRASRTARVSRPMSSTTQLSAPSTSASCPSPSPR